MLEAASLSVAARAELGPIGTRLGSPVSGSFDRFEIILSVGKLALVSVWAHAHFHVRDTQLGFVQLCVDVFLFGEAGVGGRDGGVSQFVQVRLVFGGD